MISKRFRILFWTLMTCSVALPKASKSQDLFPDKNLEAVVRREVFEKRESKEPLVPKDVENISQIKGVGKGIQNLKGLEACKSLRSKARHQAQFLALLVETMNL